MLDDGTPLNATFTSAPVGYAGVATDGGHALVANAGQYNMDLGAGADFNGGNGTFNADAEREGDQRHGSSRIHSTRARASSKRLIRRTTAAAPTPQPIYGTLAADAPTNPFQQADHRGRRDQPVQHHRPR